MDCSRRCSATSGIESTSTPSFLQPSPPESRGPSFGGGGATGYQGFPIIGAGRVILQSPSGFWTSVPVPPGKTTVNRFLLSALMKSMDAPAVDEVWLYAPLPPDPVDYAAAEAKRIPLYLRGASRAGSNGGPPEGARGGQGQGQGW
ncbi:hypothetical protein CHLRE_12g540800v5 [Chlamydomonas reinhardtii]|uniref:Uncharacterized protein n=1 Tax=Chlamydomonas reinhardtii TaxID=3055 RepID=A8IYV5_CHLRE|nr:uncharacterized protein CHLRE_12g540800v5 [Chlamydomonas reinhardtii]PNW76283.1 hypothetical protein CHLRE_12g540800v5 [Chlamydomonas reinhardtii]|eukprot:XP_001694064.1 predicted protein [Chlamydomonas reinhardtii]